MLKDDLKEEIVTSRKNQFRNKKNFLGDPIYSEIEENSMHITGNPNFDNCTGIQKLMNENSSEILYAKVNKSRKPIVDTSDCQLYKQQQVPLAKIIQNSIKTKKNLTNVPLPPLPEPPGSESEYYTPLHYTKNLKHCPSLNNVGIMEQNTVPNVNNYLSKSNLSIHRSEIFLQNLYRSELVGFSKESLEKVQNVSMANFELILLSNGRMFFNFLYFTG